MAQVTKQARIRPTLLITKSTGSNCKMALKQWALKYFAYCVKNVEAYHIKTAVMQ